MCTLPLNTCRAIAPPINAAAMLSRKAESTNTIASRARPPCQPSGRNAGISSGNAAVLEMPRQQRKAHQQQEQVREHDGFVLQVQGEAGETAAILEAGEDQLVEDDHRKAGQRDLQRLVVKQGDADQRQREQDEVDRDAEYVDGLTGRGLRYGRGGGQGQGKDKGSPPSRCGRSRGYRQSTGARFPPSDSGPAGQPEMGA